MNKVLSSARHGMPGACVAVPMDRAVRPQTLFIACGALAKELVELKRASGWSELTITCLPAHWHNTPQKIAPAVLRKIRSARRSFDQVFVIYGDCGTGGELDRVLEPKVWSAFPARTAIRCTWAPRRSRRAPTPNPGASI